MPIDLKCWALCLAAIFVSGILRGFSGFGFALAAAPLLGSLLTPAQAIPIVLILQIGSSLMGFRGTLTNLDRRSVITLGLTAVLTAPLGVALLLICNAQMSRIIIAVMTLLSVAALSAGLRFESRPSIGKTVPFGVIAGVFSGLCAMPGPPVILYYMASPVSNQSARASMIALFLLTGVGSLISAQHAGLITLDMLRVAAAGIPGMVLGTWLGSCLFTHYQSAFYKKISLLTLIAIAAVSGLRALI